MHGNVYICIIIHDKSHDMQCYYGESLPFGWDFSPANMGYLAVEQALADYAVLVQQLKETYQITNVVALGGRSVLYS